MTEAGFRDAIVVVDGIVVVVVAHPVVGRVGVIGVDGGHEAGIGPSPRCVLRMWRRLRGVVDVEVGDHLVVVDAAVLLHVGNPSGASPPLVCRFLLPIVFSCSPLILLLFF